MNLPPMFPVAAVIVGAGAGTRFGEPKAGARLDDGTRFVDAVCATARLAGLAPVVAVLPPGVPAPENTLGVANPDATGEQVTSLRIGLARLANTNAVGAIVWPVDHPFVALESVLAVLDTARRTGAPIVVPELGGRRGHPVFFHRETWRELMTVASGGARAVVHAHGPRVAEVPVADRGILRDVDTRADMDLP
ncbi:MAG TPA: nucleotidyltransferase family protein [Gemmatimonadaceae bacterium]|nr:nucleotidyltransferase family protein [Gemmatimonadaceae bacterium]